MIYTIKDAHRQRSITIEDLKKKGFNLPFQEDSSFEEFKDRLSFLESLKSRETPVQSGEYQWLPGYSSSHNKEWVDKQIDELEQESDVLSGLEKNLEICDLLSHSDTRFENQLGCRIILPENKNPFQYMKGILSNHPEFRKHYQPIFWEEGEGEFSINLPFSDPSFAGVSPSLLSYKMEQLSREGKALRKYGRCSTINLHKYKQDKVSNTTTLNFVGSSAGIIGSLLDLVKVLEDNKIPAHIGGSSRNHGSNAIGIIYDPSEGK